MKYLGVDENFLALDKVHSDITNSKVVIIPAPYEHSVSYGEGTIDGPDAILDASAYVEFYDDEFDRELCNEIGIATCQAIDFNGKVDEEAIDIAYKCVKEHLEDNKFVVTIGGEHTISIAPIKAHFEKYPEMSILHFDAHSDLRNKYEGSKYSHACAFARVIDFFPPHKLTQVGIRAQCIEESKLIKRESINTFYASSIRRGVYGDNWQKFVVDSLSDEIYISFDVDYFDPAVIPSTGTPEPDGFLYNETLEIFREIVRQQKQIIGFDLVEFAPIEGLSYPDITSARLIYKILNYAFAV